MMDSNQNPSTTKVIYTDIQKMDGSEQEITDKTLEWQKFTQKFCTNPKFCTSDLMYYETEPMAQEMKRELLESYNKPGTYIVEKVDFR